jgi:hypothetical protein
MYILKKSYLVVLVLLFLSACQSTDKFKFKSKNFQITEVQVNLPASIETAHKLAKPTESFHDYMVNAYRNYVAEYNAMRPGAQKGYKLRVDVSNVHFKNVVASLLVGDANRLEATASVIDPASGAIVHSAPASYFDSASGALNGITGAVLSVVVKREAAEAKMAKGSAKNAMKLIYPDLKLAPGAEKRLKAKFAIQPRTTAISSLSAPQVEPASQNALVAPDAESVGADTSEPKVVTLNQ